MFCVVVFTTILSRTKGVGDGGSLLVAANATMDDLNFASDATLPSARAMAKSHAPPPHYARVEPLLPFCYHGLSHTGSPIRTASNAYHELPFRHHRCQARMAAETQRERCMATKGENCVGRERDGE